MKPMITRLWGFVLSLMIPLAWSHQAQGESLSRTVDGGWTSGGGELLEDAHNPWFVRTYSLLSTISYCIDRDEDQFGVTQQTAQDVIRSAIEQWRRDFQYAGKPPGIKSTPYYVADEMWVERPCPKEGEPDDIMVRFQLGTLTAAQRQELDQHHIDPTHYISLAIRQHYNRQTLRGSGFIYVSPSQGILRSKAADMVENPWATETGNAFFAVVMHELGHVFGVPHGGTNQQLMGASFPEYAVSRRFHTFTLSVFRQPLETMMYGTRCFLVNDKVKALFQLSPEVRWITFEMSMDREIYLKKIDEQNQCNSRDFNHEDSLETLGKIVLEEEPVIDMTPLVNLWVLPKLQKVISGIQPNSEDQPVTLDGPMVVRQTFSGQFYGMQRINVPHAVTVYFSPEFVRIGGFINGRIEPEAIKLEF